jgi:hypothetical protein
MKINFFYTAKNYISVFFIIYLQLSFYEIYIKQPRIFFCFSRYKILFIFLLEIIVNGEKKSFNQLK